MPRGLASPDEGFIPPATTAYVASVLRDLGYKVHMHLVPFTSITASMWRGFQISVDGDSTVNYPNASAYLPLFLSCGGGLSNGYYCNPALDRDTQRAERLTLTDAPKSRTLWESIDRQLTNAAVCGNCNDQDDHREPDSGTRTIAMSTCLDIETRFPAAAVLRTIRRPVRHPSFSGTSE